MSHARQGGSMSMFPAIWETICLKAMAKSAADGTDLEGVARRPAPAIWRQANQGPQFWSPERLWRWCRVIRSRESITDRLSRSAAALVPVEFVHLLCAGHRPWSSTRMEIAMLEDVNDFYSEVVVGWTRTDRVSTYVAQKNALPLPATFIIDSRAAHQQERIGHAVRI